MLVLLELGSGRNACRPFPLKSSSLSKLIKTYQNLPKPTQLDPYQPDHCEFLPTLLFTIYSDYVSVFSFKTIMIVAVS